MTSRPIRMIFLGNRRIAWEILKILSSDAYQSRFEICAIVTDERIWREYMFLNPYGNALYIPSHSRQSDTICDVIKLRSVEMLLSVQYNWIIPANVLELVNGRAFNLHNARLPDYKGYHSISHAIASGDVVYESTVHWMTDVVDSGDIAYVERTLILSDDTAQSLYIRTISAAVTAVKHLLQDLTSGAEVPRLYTPKGQGRFFGRDSVTSLANVTEIVDSERLASIARAAFFPPSNTAHFFYDGKKYLVVPESEVDKMSESDNSVNEPLF